MHNLLTRWQTLSLTQKVTFICILAVVLTTVIFLTVVTMHIQQATQDAPSAQNSGAHGSKQQPVVDEPDEKNAPANKNGQTAPQNTNKNTQHSTGNKSATVSGGSNTPGSTAPSGGTTTPSCQLPSYPKPSCTGVPAGTALTTINGDYVAGTPGEVIDGKRITGGIIIAADNVVVKNSEVWAGIGNGYSGALRHPYSVMDSTVGHPTVCDYPSGEGFYLGFGETDFTALRVQLRNVSDGFRDSGNNILIQDSYVHLCTQNPNDHSDGVQGYLGGTNVKIYHNTIDQRDVIAAAQTAPIFISDGSLDADIRDNLLAGGSQTIRVYNAGGTYNVSNNMIVNNSWLYGPVSSSCGFISWSNNRLVTIDNNYNVLSVLGIQPCIEA